jgi:hypothetical protein
MLLSSRVNKLNTVFLVLMLFIGLIFSKGYCEMTATDITLPSRQTNKDKVLILQAEVPSKVKSGDIITMKLVVKNISGKAMMLGLPSYLCYFVVSKIGGSNGPWITVGGSGPENIIGVSFAEDELKVFEKQWDQKNKDGELVPPGLYEVQGVLSAEISEQNIGITSKPQCLQILPN